MKKHSIRVFYSRLRISHLLVNRIPFLYCWLAMRRRLCTFPSVPLMKSRSTKTTNQWNSRWKKENAQNVEKSKITETRLEKVEEVVRAKRQVSRRFIRQKNRTENLLILFSFLLCSTLSPSSYRHHVEQKTSEGSRVSLSAYVTVNWIYACRLTGDPWATVREKIGVHGKWKQS